MKNNGKITGGELLVECLKIHGAKTIFGVPGESYLAVLDALHDVKELDYVICRQEGGASMMAETYGKLTGRPGICMVSRGPGATNASAGIHIAAQDSTPLILLIGQVGRKQKEREAYQELDYRRMFGQMTKWVAEITSAERIPEYVSRAFFTATAGRPGPVVLALPEDMLEDEIDLQTLGSPHNAVYTGPAQESITELQGILEQAKKPIMIVGGGGWTQKASSELQNFVERWDMPLAVSLRCQDYFDNEHPNYIGEMGVGINAKLADRVLNADTLFVLGPRLGDMTTSGYTLLTVPEPVQKLIHVHSSAEELGRVYIPALGINSSSRQMAASLNLLKPVAKPPWATWRKEARQDYLDWSTPQATIGKVQLAEMVYWLRNKLPSNSIICTGAGNYANWFYRFYRYRNYHSQLAPTSGTMGYSIPAAVAAKILHPDREVIAVAGDGCFMMHGQELATAAQQGLKIIVLIINNSIFGTIRMHQERAYPNRVIGTQLKNPSFTKLVEAYGGKGYLVENTDEFYLAFEDAQQQDGLSLIEVRIDEELIAPLRTISDIRGLPRTKKK